jgi:hypothetical protein
MGAVNSRFVVNPHPSKETAAEELVRSLANLTKVIDENPSIHHLFNDVDLRAAHKAIRDYQWIIRYEANEGLG